MVTLAGKQKDILSLLNNLIELDFDAIEAYKAAVARIKDRSTQDRLGDFMADHQRHVNDLTILVRQMGGAPETKADMKQVLTKGRVVIAGLVGDRAVLVAMKANEDDTNTAYERAVAHENLSSDVRVVLERNLSDERRHRAWIEDRIAVMDQEKILEEQEARSEAEVEREIEEQEEELRRSPGMRADEEEAGRGKGI